MSSSPPARRRTVPRPPTVWNARRRAEAGMLALAVFISVFGYLQAGLAQEGRVPDGLAGFTASVLLLAVAAHVAVVAKAPHADPLILPLSLLLTGLGLVLLHRLDVSYAQRFGAEPTAQGQVMWSAIGVGACAVTLVLLRDHRRLQRWMYVIMAVALVLLLAPAFFPGDTYGAKRWIYLGPMSFQPGEFVKIMIAIFFAGYLTHTRHALALTGRRFLGLRLPPGRQFGPIVAIWVLSLLVLIFERDLGTSLIFFGMFVVMLYAATERLSWVIFGVLMAVAGAAVVGSTEPHVKGRVQAWLHPMDAFLPPDQQKFPVNEQSAQALFSFGSGGVTGTGLGQGHPDLIGFAGRSDFILTTVGEELGLAGTMVVLMLYGLLAQRALRAALASRGPFGKLLATGLAMALVLQVFVVAGGVMGMIPLTGKALPFLAKGGSSLVANWILIALLLRISDDAAPRADAESDEGEETDATDGDVLAGPAPPGSSPEAAGAAPPGTAPAYAPEAPTSAVPRIPPG